MQITPALENEKKRNDVNSWNKIYLHKDGSFYHIYEWSAWLVKTLICTEAFQKERGDDKILSAPRYKTKNNEYILIGFPVESLSKFIPKYTDIRELEDGRTLEIDIELDLNGDETYDILQERFTKWKKAQPENKKQEKKNDAIPVSRVGVFGIISEIINYPIERKTMEENSEFLSSIKNKITSLL